MSITVVHHFRSRKCLYGSVRRAEAIVRSSMNGGDNLATQPAT